MNKPIDVVVAGHTCMDLLPSFSTRADRIEQFLKPGKLINVGPLVNAMGGTVPNTGGALNRFGLTVCLMGKVGDDVLGQGILDLMRSSGMPTQGMIVEPGGSTSYTIVLSIPGLDRIPLHYPGLNDEFCADDIDYETVAKARHFHFGYPPVMRGMFVDGGAQLAEVFRRAKEKGVRTSLDMARPDPDAESGKVDWRAVLRSVLPDVDIFTPSFDELLYMLDRERFDAFEASRDPARGLDLEELNAFGSELLDMGAGSVLMKLGDLGAYVYSEHEQVYSSCFCVDVVGAIGSGDCTIAGYLAGTLRGLTVSESLECAVGAGACNVEAADAHSGIPDWDSLQRRIGSGWRKQESPLV